MRTAEDCAPISDAWFASWCRDLASYRPGNVPSTLDGQIGQDTAALIYAALTWSLLHGDASICDNPVVGAFLSFEGTPPSPMPSPSTSPAQHCRDDLHITLGLAVTHGNRISLTSPETQADATVALPDGRPLPTLPAS